MANLQSTPPHRWFGRHKALFLGALLVGLTLLRSGQLFAQTTPVPTETVYTLDADRLAVMHPAGLAYAPDSGVFLLRDAAQGAPTATQDTVTFYNPTTNLIQVLPIAGGATSPSNLTYDSAHKRLLFLDQAAQELVSLPLTGDLATAASAGSVSRESVAALGLQQPQGLALDAATGALFMLDSSRNEVIRIAPASDGTFGIATAQNDGRLSAINLSDSGVHRGRGLAFNAADGHLYILEPATHSLTEITVDGQLVKVYDLKNSGLINPQAIVFAPSGDTTDDASTVHLYIADAGVQLPQQTTVDSALLTNKTYLPWVQTEGNPVGQEVTATTEIPGKVVEVALDWTEPQVQAAASAATLALVRTIDTSKFSPSSPDPCGITYVPAANQFIISDSEVDEIKALFKNKNIFTMSMAGIGQGMMNTIPFSKEPTGVSFNASNGHLFYADDDLRKIFEVDPGADQTLGTSDDTTTSFSVATFGGRDPEDVAYDATNPGLWIIDGLNAEVYHLLPGANGRFDGVSPDGDDVLTQFDTYKMNVRDPEGIYLDPASGNLILTSKDPTKLYEVSTSGVLLRIFDAASAGGVKFAGVTLAPGSNNAGVMNFYVVDRVVDNNDVSTENDGKIYELTLSSGGASTPTATATATPTKTPTTAPTATSTTQPANTPTPTATATATPLPGPTLSFSPSDDTFVRSDFPNSIYATGTDIRTRGGTTIINSYVKFTVTGVSGAVQSAKLRLYVTDPSDKGGALYLVSNNYLNSSTPWVESGLKYSNAPEISGTPLASLGSVATGAWVEFNVTAAINGNGVYSFGLTSSSTNSVFYSSINASANQPVLVIQP